MRQGEDVSRRREPASPELLCERCHEVEAPGVDGRGERHHERWELELEYDELKTELLEHEETIRSKTRDGVGQELCGLLLAYNLVRVEMERIAKRRRSNRRA